jgi:hypothetical protein
MRLPNITNYDNISDIVDLNIPKLTFVDKDYRINNDKDKYKFIKHIELIVRSSLEYSQYIQFLKEEMDMSKCIFFNNINADIGKGGCKIEIHHEPFTLYDITHCVLNKYIDNELELNPFTIAEEVMELHYRNLVGLVPVSKTTHTLIHDGELFIPLQYVYGEYVKFIEEYDRYLGDLVEILKIKLDISKDIDSHDYSILQTKYLYVNVDGIMLPQLIQ